MALYPPGASYVVLPFLSQHPPLIRPGRSLDLSKIQPPRDAPRNQTSAEAFYAARCCSVRSRETSYCLTEKLVIVLCL